MAHIAETELDARVLARALWRRSWLLALLALAVAAATYYALGAVQPLYVADTSILIEERESPLTRPRDSADGARVEFDESAIQSQVEVLRSRQIAEVVIDRLDLARDPRFDPASDPSLLDRLMVMLGLEEHPVEKPLESRVMDKYFDRLSVYPLAKSRVIGVAFEAPDPVLAADVANAVAESFVDLQQEAKRESAVAATAWLEQEIERLRERVAEAEQAVADYRVRTDLFYGDGSGNLSSQQLGDLNAELARARAARSEAEARAELVQSLLAEGGALEASQEVLNSALVQRLRERQVALQAQIADLSTTFLPGHPRIQALQGQLANLEGQIRQEARKIQASLDTAARVAAAREESLVASLDVTKSAVSLSNEQEIQLRALEREAAAQRDLLESFLARYREALARTDANYLPADARIISRAVPPSEPSYPKKTMMAVAAGLAALLIGAAILLLREFTSGRAFRVIGYDAPPLQAAPRALTDQMLVRTAGPAAGGGETLAVAQHFADERRGEEASVDPEPAPQPGPGPDMEPELDLKPRAEPEPGPDIEPELDLQPASAPPASAFPTPAAVALANESDTLGAAELAEIIVNPAVRLALFAGAKGGEGAGDVAYSAAREAARRNHRVVLMDVGLTPSEALGGRDTPGLGDLLSGEAAFGEVIRRDDAARVHAIPMGATDGNPPLQRLQLVIGALTHTYDKVIVVADSLDDWPDEHVRPDVAAIVCGPETGELSRTEIYETALARGAKNALIVRYDNDWGEDGGGEESEAA